MRSDSNISVIIPLYNGARHIEACLTSILAQSRPAAEVIVIDDGSSDDGPSRAKAHPIKPTIVHQPNNGPAAARNRGIACAKYDFLAFNDQDDLWHPRKLEWQMAAFERHETLQLCYGRVDLFWDDKNCSEAKAFANHTRAKRVAGYISPALLARRAAFDRLGLLDETLRFGDGSAWAARAQDECVEMHLLDKVVLYHRMHASNLTRKRDESAKEFLSILHKRRRAKAGELL